MSKRTIDSLAEHPNIAEILGVLAQLPHISDADLPRLADAWQNSVPAADARAKALAMDAPLVLDVLSAFETVQSLFAEDMSGSADYISVEPMVTSRALKAVRDAIAAAYGRPVLSRGHRAALMKAWRTVYPAPGRREPDLGPEAARVEAALAVLVLLSQRCHDKRAAVLFGRLSRVSATLDPTLRNTARAETWGAALLTSRRRIWGLVRSTGEMEMGRFCPGCRARHNAEEDGPVLELCLDAACALLVADAVDNTLVDILTLPLVDLLPGQRPPAD